MKRILFIFLILISISQGYSQIITNVNIQGIDCNNSLGYISITTDIPTTFIKWWKFDDFGDSIVLPSFDYLDSISTNECGKYS